MDFSKQHNRIFIVRNFVSEVGRNFIWMLLDIVILTSVFSKSMEFYYRKF